MKTSKIQLVVDDFGADVSAVTHLLGLEPTAVAVDEGRTPGRQNPGTSWIFEIAMPETESVEGQALALLRFLQSHAEVIRQTAARYPTSIAIGINYQGEPGPGEFNLVPLVVADISKLGLGIRIHL